MSLLKFGLEFQGSLPNLSWSPLGSLTLQIPAPPPSPLSGSGSRTERPLVVVLWSPSLPSALQVEYLVKKVLSSMSLELGLGELEELLAQEAQAAQAAGGLSVWQFLELFNSGRCLRGVGQDALSMAIHEVYQELIQDVLKQVRHWELGQAQRRAAGAWTLLTWLWPAGLPVEARTPEEELDRALVPAAAQLPVLLWE